MFAWLKRDRGPKRLDTWQNARLFRGMTEAHLEVIAPHVSERELAAGEVLVAEGEPALDLYIVRDGTLEVTKLGDGRDVAIGEIGTGEVIGEVALFDELPRSATVRASEPCSVYVMRFHDLRPSSSLMARSSLDPRPKPVRRAYSLLLENLASVLADRLRQSNEQLRELAKQREAVGSFIVRIMLLVCLYTFLLSGLEYLGDRAPANSTLVSLPVQLIFAAGSWTFIRGTGYPLADFGLSWRYLLSSMGEAVLFTAPLLALLTGVKWMVLKVGGNPYGVALIEYEDVATRLQDPDIAPAMLVYALSCVVQELIVRGALQSSLMMFLTGRGRALKAIGITALIFAMTHLHMSFLFAALAFVPALFWGWLFARRPNVAGVTLSHIAVGTYVFFVMGVNSTY